MIDYESIVEKISPQELKRVDLTKDEVVYVMKYASYTEDGIFRSVFGSNDIKSNFLLKYLVHLIVKEEVVSAVLENTVLLRQQTKRKEFRLDILAVIKNEKGEERLVNIEMQNSGSLKENINRSQAYIARIIERQISKGDTYQLIPVHQITLLGKKLFNDSMYKHEYLYKEKDVDKVLIHNRCSIVFVELDKLEDMDIYKATELEKFLFYLKYAFVENKYDTIKMIKEENQEVYRMLEEKREKYMNEEVIYDLSDIREIFDRCIKENEMRNARKEAMEEGHKEGLKQGMQQGIHQGMEQGLQQRTREIALELLQESASMNLISKVTKLSLEEVEELARTML